MKRQLICNLAILGLLAGSAIARELVDVQSMDVAKRDRGQYPANRTFVCDDAVTIDCDFSGTMTVPAGEGLWFYYVGNGLGLELATCLPGTTADSDLYIYSGTCGSLVEELYRDGDSGCGYATYLNCSDFLFEDGVGYYILLTDYYGDEADIQFDFNCCTAPEEFACPDGVRQHVEGGEFEFCGDYANSLDCGDVVCGEIATSDDVDYYWMTVGDLGGQAPGASVELNVYGDDTFGYEPFGFGLDPWVKVYDESCTELIGSDDDGGAGFDSRLVFDCLAPGIYMVEIYTGWSAPGPYLLTMGCAPCCDETNSPANPDVVITDANFMDYVGEANAYTTTVSLCDYCNLISAGPGCFNNGHCIADLDGGEYWFNVYQPGADDADCYALLMTVSPAYTFDQAGDPLCSPLIGIAQGGALLGYFAVDASTGLYPSVYNEPGSTQSTFVIDAPAICCSEVVVSMWYEDLCIPVSANDMPVDFTLGQNYPNPFNPTTTIDFTVSETSSVNLTVSNLAGQTVATLVNGMVESGAHSVVFDASGLTTGVYFYSLETAGHSVTKKMVLVK